MNQLIAFHDSMDSLYRSPFGSVATGERIGLRIRVLGTSPIQKVILRLWKGEEGEERMIMQPVQAETGLYESFVQCNASGVLWYYFVLTYEGIDYYYSKNNDGYGGVGSLGDHPGHSYQITVYKSNYQVPAWFFDGIIYQIFPDRFCNGTPGQVKVDKKAIVHESWEEKPNYKPDPETGEILNNDFFGGNLAGIIQKLYYLKELGISIIYLNPVFQAYSNHRYDVGDYKKIDPMLGDLETFQALSSMAAEKGISIVLDGVFSHTGSDSVYFNKEHHYPGNGAWQTKDSPYYPWYRFKQYPFEYDCWWGIETLPNVNELEPTYQDYIIHHENSVIKYWLRNGARGWRLDVADELPAVFLKHLRKAVKETNEDAVIIGEVWEDASNKISYGEKREYLLGDELDSVMNYPFRSMILNYFLGHWEADRLNRAIMTLYENYPRQAFYSAMNLLGSHDVTRIKTVLSGAPSENNLTKEQQSEYILTEQQKKLGDQRQRLALLFQMTFPGVPAIYYGDEAGLYGYRDPFNRNTYPWGAEDLEMLAWYKRVIKLRNEIQALRTGDFIPILAQGDIYGYVRSITVGRDALGRVGSNERLIILFNRNIQQEHTIGIDIKRFHPSSLQDLLDTGLSYHLTEGYLTVKLKALSGIVLRCE